MQSTIFFNTTLDEFGVKTFPKIYKRVQQNFDDLVIDDEGNIEVEESDDDYAKMLKNYS